MFIIILTVEVTTTALLHSRLSMAFQCQYCGKNLTRRYYLKRHMRSFHTDESNTLPFGKHCQAGGHLAKICPEKKLSSALLGEAGLNDSTAYINPFQNNPEISKPTSQQPLPDPLGRSLISLDQTMQDVLQNHTPGDDYVKAQLYSQALQRYLRQADQYREKPLGKVTLNDNVLAAKAKPERDVSHIKSLLEATLPESLIRGGTLLADNMDTLPGVSWDDKLQLIVDGKTVQNSNILALLSDLARKKKTSKPPKGMDELLGVLKERNFPRLLIPNEARRSALDDNHSAQDDLVEPRKTRSKPRPVWKEWEY